MPNRGAADASQTQQDPPERVEAYKTSGKDATEETAVENLVAPSNGAAPSSLPSDLPEGAKAQLAALIEAQRGLEEQVSRLVSREERHQNILGRSEKGRRSVLKGPSISRLFKNQKVQPESADANANKED